MSKWDKILGGEKAAAGGIVSPDSQMTFISISMLVLFIAVAIFFVFKAKKGLNTTVISEVGTVLSKNAEKSKDVKELKALDPAPLSEASEEKIIETAEAVEAPTVKAKFSGKSYFEEAEMDDETFDHFEKAFEHGRFEPVLDKISLRNAGQKDALKDFLAHSGQSVEQFLNSDSYVPENLLNFEVKSEIREDIFFNEEESMIVKEAVQFAPSNCSDNEATLIWRDVLGALKEASMLNLKLPPVHDDQKRSLEFWSRKSGAAGTMAQSVLNRLI